MGLGRFWERLNTAEETNGLANQFMMRFLYFRVYQETKAVRRQMKASRRVGWQPAWFATSKDYKILPKNNSVLNSYYYIQIWLSALKKEQNKQNKILHLNSVQAT